MGRNRTVVMEEYMCHEGWWKQLPVSEQVEWRKDVELSYSILDDMESDHILSADVVAKIKNRIVHTPHLVGE